MEQADGYVCEGRCPVCGRRVRLTWQRTGEADACPCGLEAVLVVETRDTLKWYWRDPFDLPASSGSLPAPRAARSEPAAPAGPVQLRLV